MTSGRITHASTTDDPAFPEARAEPIGGPDEAWRRGVGNGPVAGRFVLLVASDDSDAPDWGYVTSWDAWEDAEAAFPVADGFKLRDDETGRVWLSGAPYAWAAAHAPCTASSAS